MPDCLVIGGGVVGLSIAYELAGRGLEVRVVDAGQPGREASWAGAGILPPAGTKSDDPLEQLAALSNRMHALWADQLREATGIDNGYRRSGAIYVARDAAEAAALEQLADWASQRAVVAERLALDRVADVEPQLRPSPPPHAAYLVPEESQIRNPRHLKALLAGCAQRGVEVTPGAAVDDFEVRGPRVATVRTTIGDITAERICITAGAWSGAVARKLGFAAAIRPIRGQMLLLSTARPVLSRIINIGGCYLVPRPDGRLLVGSTEEDVGFDRSTTARATSNLLRLALGLVPALADAGMERSWAGLRPATEDRLPYLGRVAGLDNAFLAAGHFRGGLQLSTGTARVMSQLITDERPEVDLDGFRLQRSRSAGPAGESQQQGGEFALAGDG